MNGFGLANKNQRPSDTFCAGEFPVDQLANFSSNIGGREKNANLPRYSSGVFLATFSGINQRVNSEPVRIYYKKSISVGVEEFLFENAFIFLYTKYECKWETYIYVMSEYNSSI